MKKIVFSTLAAVIILAAFFAYSIVYSKKQVDAFFNHNEGVLFNMSGITWELTSSEVGLFGAKYVTDFSVDGESLATFEHNASFGVRNLNILKLGNIVTKIKIKEPIEKEFIVESGVSFSGIDTEFFKEEGSLIIGDDWQHDDPIKLSWKDTKADLFTSFARDVYDFEADIPYFSASYGPLSIVIENQKYSESISKKKIGFPLGKSSVKIGKIEVIEQPITENSDGIIISKLSLESSLKESSNSNVNLDIQISIGDLNISNTDKNMQNLVFNFGLQNLDANSIKKISESLYDVDIRDENHLLFTVFSWAAYIPDILGKKPKIVLDEFSLKHNGKTNKLSGFIQYTGTTNVKEILDTWKQGLVAKFDFIVDENTAKTFIGKEYFFKELEEQFGIKAEKGVFKASFEFKNSKLTLNGKQIL